MRERQIAQLTYPTRIVDNPLISTLLLCVQVLDRSQSSLHDPCRLSRISVSNATGICPIVANQSLRSPLSLQGNRRLPTAVWGHLSMNMDHVGTQVKKIRTPRYLEAGKKKFLHLEKSGARNQRDPFLACLSAAFCPLPLPRFLPASYPRLTCFSPVSQPRKHEGQPESCPCILLCLRGALLAPRENRSVVLYVRRLPFLIPVRRASAGTVAGRLRAAIFPRPPRYAARWRRCSARGRSCRFR